MNRRQEPKYGINKNGNLFNRETGIEIPDDEPVFILRARDKQAVPALQHYVELCKIPGHKEVVSQRINDFEIFAEKNPSRMREPGEYRDK